MDYQQYRALRDRAVEQIGPLRLDCMNAAMALARLAPAPPAAIDLSLGVADVAAAWFALFEPNAHARQVLATTGVRPALRGILALLAAQGYEVWLPEDVYPVYWEVARELMLPCRPFATYPMLDLTAFATAAPRSAILLVSPLAPAGRRLAPAEVATLLTWLGAAPSRRAVLDTVYLFDNRFDPATAAIWNSGRAFVVHSLAKAWLAAGTLGTVLAPEDAVDQLEPLLIPPGKRATNLAHFCLTQRPDLPSTLQRSFERRWRGLETTIRSVIRDWRPPETGYFATLAVPFEQLQWKHHWLSVPASVFGSRRTELSIITCLNQVDEMA